MNSTHTRSETDLPCLYVDTPQIADRYSVHTEAAVQGKAFPKWRIGQVLAASELFIDNSQTPEPGRNWAYAGMSANGSPQKAEPIAISSAWPIAPVAPNGTVNPIMRPVIAGHQLPAEGSAAYRATDGPAPAACGEALRVWRDCHGADVRAAGDTFGREAAGHQSPIPGSGMVPVLAPSSGSLPDAMGAGSSPVASKTLPPATAPAACISGDAGPETTAAGGNPSINNCMAGSLGNPDAAHKEKRLSHADLPWDEASEALTLELRRKGIVSIPADTHQDEHAWRMML